jgi:hypothetical protein
MTKGLVLKILGITAVIGGLLFTNQLVSSSATGGSSTLPKTAVAAAPSAAPAAPSTEHATEAAPDPEAKPPAPANTAGPPNARRRAMLAKGATEGGPNFVSVCRFSHTNQDDPIVYPGVKGATHHHDFFANTTTDANSTLSSLRAGGTSCRIQGDTAGYWAPSLYANGKLVPPTLARIYYLPGRKDNTTVQAPPAGLKVLAKGDNVRVRWSCVGRDDRGTAQATPPTCPQGQHLVEHIHFPDCWDGKNLDTSDHMSNMTFAQSRACPSSHPTPIPAIVLNIHYPTQGGNVVLGFPDKPVAAHADFFNAWDQTTLDRLVRTCIDAGVHCGANPPGTNA